MYLLSFLVSVVVRSFARDNNPIIMPPVAKLVLQFMGELDAVEGDVLDLACGSGQNG